MASELEQIKAELDERLAELDNEEKFWERATMHVLMCKNSMQDCTRCQLLWNMLNKAN